MSDLGQDCSWSHGKFVTLVVVLFALQAGLIMLFGDRSRAAVPPRSAAMRVRALGPMSDEQLMRQFFVSDPAVFSLPNPHGFSGRGWLNHAPPNYQPEIQLEPPAFLALNAKPLGNHFPISDVTVSGIAELQSRREEPLPDFLSPEVFPTQSIFRLDPKFAERLLSAAPVLGAWAIPMPWAKPPVSTVRMAVSPNGEVLAAQLEKSCGLADADAEAVVKAWTLRFRPVLSGQTEWGEATFQWPTTAPPGPGQAK